MKNDKEVSTKEKHHDLHEIERVAQEDINEIMSKYDRESAYRTFVGYRGVIISTILILFSCLQLYSTWFIIPSTHMRPLHLAVVMLVAFLLYPMTNPNTKKSMPWYDVMAGKTIPWYDLLFAILSFGICMYQIVFFEKLSSQNKLDPYEFYMAIVGIVLLMEACRRVVGMPIVIIATIFIISGLFGQSMPGFLANRGFTPIRIVQYLWYTQEGIFGTPLGASSTFIFLFILFGSFLEKTGVGEFFIDLSNAVAGHKRGGPAKVAIITSALEGTVSGSSVANTVGSGSFTIPMMKKLGYRPEFAAAVESAASTGGQIMPPIMGAAAFLMSESLGLQYSIIIKAAIIPALLYFAGVYIITDIEAKKQGLQGMSKENMPKLKKILVERGHLIVPLIAIIAILTMGFTPSVAALAGIFCAICASYVRPLVIIVGNLVTRKKWNTSLKTDKSVHGMTFKDYLSALEGGARSIISVALACGVAGIIAGMITLTGVGQKIGAGLTTLAGGNILLLLVFTMFASILLGMGVPTTANYLITSTIMAPVVAKALLGALPEVYTALGGLGMGYNLLPAHLFTFYFGIVADITPPVALAAMAGAAIAKSDPLKTGVEATKVAIAAFLIPFIFVFNPQMLMLNAAWYEVAWIAITATVGMVGIGIAVEKFWTSKVNIFEQLIALAGGLMLIAPGIVTDIAGIACIALIMFLQNRKKLSKATL